MCWSLPLLAAEPIRSDPFADLGLELRAAQEATITKKHTPAQRSDGNENARTTTTTTTARANSRAPATRRMNGRYETSTSRVPSTSNRPTDTQSKALRNERARKFHHRGENRACSAHARALTSTMRCAADSKSLTTLACESSLALGTVMFTATKS